MSRYFLSVQFVLLVSFTSCNGQGKPTPLASQVIAQNVTATGTPTLIKTQKSNEYDNVHCGLQDRAGNLWFGTTGEGVYRYDGKLFTQFTQKDGLSSNKVWSILEDKAGNIWFGTDQGVCRFDGKAIVSVPIRSSNLSSLYLSSSVNELAPAKKAVWSMLQDRSGNIWFGTDEGLYRFDGKTFTRLLDDPAILNTGKLTLKSVQCMLEDQKGNFWFGSGPMAFEGLCRYDGQMVESFKPKNEGWIRNIIQDLKGDIVFATRHNGACRYDGKNFTFISNELGMVYNSMMACFEDKAGNTWFSSDYGTTLNDSVGGAWRYDGKTLTKFSIKDGLTNNAVFLIMEDRSGNIWIGTRNIGLYRYDGKTITSFSS